MSDWADLVAPKPSTAVLNGHGYTYRQRFSWVEYPAVQPMQLIKNDPLDEEEEPHEEPAIWWDEEFVGFRARVLANPNGGELRHEQQLTKQLQRKIVEEEDYFKSLAYRVVEWDFVIIDREGNRFDVPAPAQDSWERFLDLPPMLLSWLVLEIRVAHLPKAPASGLTSGKNAGSTVEPTPIAIDPSPEPQTS